MLAGGVTAQKVKGGEKKNKRKAREKKEKGAEKHGSKKLIGGGSIINGAYPV